MTKVYVGSSPTPGANERHTMAVPALTKKIIRQREWNRKVLINKYNATCAHCGDQVNLIHDHPKQATIDHILPLSRGGLDNLTNMQLLCNDCNQSKGNRLEEEINHEEVFTSQG